MQSSSPSPQQQPVVSTTVASAPPLTRNPCDFVDVTGRVVRHPSHELLKAAALAARARVPPSAHLGFPEREGRHNAVDCLLQQEIDQRREPDLLPVRHGRMSVSPLAHYRAHALSMALDLQHTPVSGLPWVWSCNDAHLSNFGLYASAERNLVFDCVDMDETWPAPFEFDVKRLVTSFVIASQHNGFSAEETLRIAREVGRSYRCAMKDFSECSHLEVFYKMLPVDKVIDELYGDDAANRPSDPLDKHVSVSDDKKGGKKKKHKKKNKGKKNKSGDVSEKASDSDSSDDESTEKKGKKKKGKKNKSGDISEKGSDSEGSDDESTDNKKGKKKKGKKGTDSEASDDESSDKKGKKKGSSSSWKDEVATPPPLSRQQTLSEAGVPWTKKVLRKAREADHTKVMRQLVIAGGGSDEEDEHTHSYSFKSEPPVLISFDDLAAMRSELSVNLAQAVIAPFENYRNSLSPDVRHLLSKYRVVDGARKVVGVGSVGTRCFVVLLVGQHAHDFLFIQIKEASKSCVEVCFPEFSTAIRERFAITSHGARVVVGQRIMQASSDPFLGHARGFDETRHYYFRQLKDMKGSVEPEKLSPTQMFQYATLCGWTLARCHAKSGDPFLISAYLEGEEGSEGGHSFDDAWTDFGLRYSEVNQKDFAKFKEALASGKVQAIYDV